MHFTTEVVVGNECHKCNIAKNRISSSNSSREVLLSKRESLFVLSGHCVGITIWRQGSRIRSDHWQSFVSYEESNSARDQPLQLKFKRYLNFAGITTTHLFL